MHMRIQVSDVIKMAAQNGGSFHLSSDFVVYVESDVLATSYPTKKKGAWIDYLRVVLILMREMPINFWSWFNTTRLPSELFLSPLEVPAQASNPSSMSKTTTSPPLPPLHNFGNIKSLRFFDSNSPLLVEKYSTGGRFKIVYNLGSDALNRHSFDNLWLDFLLFMISSSNIDGVKKARLAGVVCKPQSYAGRSLNNDHICLELWFDHNINYAAFVCQQITSQSSDDSSNLTSCSVYANDIEDSSSKTEASANTRVFDDECPKVAVCDPGINSNSDNDGNSCNNSISNNNSNENSDKNKSNNACNNNNDGDMSMSMNMTNYESEFEVSALVSTVEVSSLAPRKFNFETLSARRRLSYLLEYTNISTNLEPAKVEFESFIK